MTVTKLWTKNVVRTVTQPTERTFRNDGDEHAIRASSCAHRVHRRETNQASSMAPITRRRPSTERRVVADGDERACVSMVSVKGAL